MEEKQEFQLGDTFYCVCNKCDFKCWYFAKDIVKGIELDGETIYLKGEKVGFMSQRKCGHTPEEAKEIAMKDWRKKNKEIIQKIKELEEK